MQFPRSTRLIGAALALLAAAACSDHPSAIEPSLAGHRAALDAATRSADLVATSAATLTSPLANTATAGCLDVKDGATGPMGVVLTATCAGTASQSWTLPAVGETGMVTVFGGAMCLDDWGAQGRAGDLVGTYYCVAGAPSQAWTLTAAGELKGINGLCVQAAAGVQATLQTCTGGTTQLWSPTTVAAAPPATTTPGTTTLVDAAAGACAEVRNGATGAMGVVWTAACASGATRQAWTIPAVGTSGRVTIYNVCLDDWGGNGRVGDLVGTYTCVGTAPSQQWQLTTAGALRGVNGLCVQAGTPSATQLTLQTCTGAANQRWTAPGSAAPPTAETPPATTPPPSTGAQTTLLSSATGRGCLEALDGANAPGVIVTVGLCQSGAAKQTWSIPGVGTAGQLTLFGGAQCLDDWGGRGLPGDNLGTWTCVAGAASEQWTLTAAGELKGMNGLCAVAPDWRGGQLTLQACNGSAAQRWVLGTTPDVTTQYPATAPATGAAAVFGLMGQSPSVAAMIARGGTWARYEQDFATYADRHWTSEGADNYNANYYDRAMIYYVWWARTGNATYLERAHQLAINHRTFLEQQNFVPQPFNLMIDGVTLHALLTGDERSKTAVARVADGLLHPQSYWARYVGVIEDPGLDARTQARVLTAAVDAMYLRVQSPAGLDYAAQTRAVLTKILGTQAADGAFRFSGQCYQGKSFMTGMLNDVLARYYTVFEADARIPGAVKKSVDYLWTANWLPATGEFEYLDAPCNGEFWSTAELNNLIVTGFGFVGKQTGDASYFTKGDAIFASSVANQYLIGTKQFNQQYTTSHRYLGLRF